MSFILFQSNKWLVFDGCQHVLKIHKPIVPNQIDLNPYYVWLQD